MTGHTQKEPIFAAWLVFCIFTMKYQDSFSVLLGVCMFVLAGCQKQEEAPVVQGKHVLTLEATKGAQTKALSLSEGVLNATWNNGEQVAVFNGSKFLGNLTAAVDQDGASKATLSGDLIYAGDADVVKDTKLSLLFPRSEWDYRNQDGSLSGIASNYDYSTSQVELDEDDVTYLSSRKKVSFTPEQSIYLFTFNGGALSVKSFTLSSSKNKLVEKRKYYSKWTSTCNPITVSRETASKDGFYVALRNENTTQDDSYSFTVAGKNNAVYSGSKNVAASYLGNGKFLSADVTVAQDQITILPGTLSTSENVL